MTENYRAEFVSQLRLWLSSCLSVFVQYWKFVSDRFDERPLIFRFHSIDRHCVIYHIIRWVAARDSWRFEFRRAPYDENYGVSRDVAPRMGKDNKKKGAAHERARRVLHSSHPAVQYRDEYPTGDDNTSLNNSFARSFERAKFTKAHAG